MVSISENLGHMPHLSAQYLGFCCWMRAKYVESGLSLVPTQPNVPTQPTANLYGKSLVAVAAAAIVDAVAAEWTAAAESQCCSPDHA